MYLKLYFPSFFCSFESEMKFSLLKMLSTYTGWNPESLWILQSAFIQQCPIHYDTFERVFKSFDFETMTHLFYSEMIICLEFDSLTFILFRVPNHSFLGLWSFCFFSSCSAKLSELSLLKCKKSILATNDIKNNEKYLGNTLKLSIWVSITYILKNC